MMNKPLLRSHRRQFALRPLGADSTLLEGTTWYTIRVHPNAYWRLWSDRIIHSIHARVLEHLKRDVEGRMAPQSRRRTMLVEPSKRAT